jgi:spermidine synthase
VVWFPLLQLTIGSTTASLGWLLAAFMGGMCLGSLLYPRLAAKWHPWRAYAALELGIGLLGLAVLYVVPPVSGLYTAWVGDGAFGSLLRGAVAGLCITPPAILMGATLPALARCVGGSSADSGQLYAANLVGAVFGCLWAGFSLLPQYDMATATYAAVGVNFAVAALAFFVAPRSVEEPVTQEAHAPADQRVLLTIALSGFCALGSEVLWTRTLGLLFGASAYGLSLILTAFLAGLGLGSFAGNRIDRPRTTLGLCQLLSCAAMAWASYSMTRSLPYWPINPAISSDVWFSFELDLVRALWVLLPATVLWGASFPLALRAASATNAMARVYSANTLGSIAGALVASLWMVGSLGSQNAQRILIAVAAMSGLLLVRRWTVLAASAAIAAATITVIPPLSPLLAAYGRYAATWVNKGEIIYAGEGRNSTVAVSRFDDGLLTFHVAGKIQASNVARDLRLQRMLGHLTTLAVPQPKSVLVIGCGAGVTAGAVSIDPRVEHLTIAEIEPLVPQAAAKYFGDANFNVLQSPKTRVHFDDGRHFLLTSREKFDGITVDPLDPWVSGAANLYTKEFYEAAKSHLNPGGSITMYVQLFETTPQAIKSTIATFLEVFPNGTLWGNPYNGRGHDMVLLGTVEPLRIDLDAMESRVDYRGDSALSQSLTEVEMNSPIDLFATYAGRKADLGPWLAHAAINRDANLRMQYLAGLGLDRDDSAAIYTDILKRRRFPEDLFTSTEGRTDSLRRALESGQ